MHFYGTLHAFGNSCKFLQQQVIITYDEEQVVKGRPFSPARKNMYAKARKGKVSTLRQQVYFRDTQRQCKRVSL